MFQIESGPLYLQESLNGGNHSFYLSQIDLDHLTPCYCGFERCTPGHSYGPAIRDHFYYHYIVSGTGVLTVQNTSFQIAEGQGFIIFPHQIARYQADLQNPWAYMWAAFSGDDLEELLQKSSGISRHYPVVKHQHPETAAQLLNAMIGFAQEDSSLSSLQIAGLVLLLLGEICQSGEGQTVEKPLSQPGFRHIEKAVYYMKTFYYQPISMQKVAEYVGVDSSYLSRLFQQYFHLTPVQFLNNYRLNIAIQLLLTTEMPVNEAAAAVGFSDPLYFSRKFKQFTGKTPSAYRRGYG